jgi:hypothetical protein
VGALVQFYAFYFFRPFVGKSQLRPCALSAQANGVMFKRLSASRRKLPEIRQIDYQNKLSKESLQVENFKIYYVEISSA